MKKFFFSFFVLFFLFFSCVAPGDSKVNGNDSTLGNTDNGKDDDNDDNQDGGSKDDTVDLSDYNALFNHDNLHHLEIQITRAEWDGMVQDMLDYNNKYRSYRTGNYRKADLVYKGKAFEGDAGESGDKTIAEIAIRTRGNTTRVIPENPKSSGKFYRSHFAIKFNKTFSLSEGSPEYEKRKDRRFCNLRGINLKFQNIWSQDEDPSMFRELYSYDLMNRMGITAPKTGIAKLYFKIKESDGSTTTKYYGIYTMIEPIDKSFLTRRYGKDQNDGNLYKCLWQQNGASTLRSTSGKLGVEKWETNYRPSMDLTTNEDNPNFDDIKTFVSNINSSQGTSYLENNFEIDRFLRWLAANMLLGMPDDYWSMGNNYFLYFNNSNGKCEFIPYDYDHGLGGGWNGNVGYDAIKNADIEKWFYNAGGDRSDRPLVDKLLSNTQYMAKYKQYLADFIKPENKLFDWDDYLARFNKVKSLVSADLNGVSDLGSTINLTMENKSFVKDYFDGKIASVKRQLTGISEPTTTTTINSATPTTTTTTTIIDLGYKSPEITSDSVIFRYKYSGTNPLLLRGTFNKWEYNEATANWRMTDTDNDGIYEITKSKTLVPNDSRYKFFFGDGPDDNGGTWARDPANPNMEGDDHSNSILIY